MVPKHGICSPIHIYMYIYALNDLRVCTHTCCMCCIIAEFINRLWFLFRLRYQWIPSSVYWHMLRQPLFVVIQTQALSLPWSVSVSRSPPAASATTHQLGRPPTKTPLTLTFCNLYKIKSKKAEKKKMRENEKEISKKKKKEANYLLLGFWNLFRRTWN